ncbi:MAG: hypothetical protein NVV74_01125 [Magnetospirillum sp.]|nr:hypothetical protein [Magnetospirillum sp.]
MPKRERRPRPARSSGRNERLVAAFLLGLLLFMPPLLAVASRDVAVGGIPLLYLWLFGGWAALIAVLALVVERWRDPDSPP